MRSAHPRLIQARRFLFSERPAPVVRQTTVTFTTTDRQGLSSSASLVLTIGAGPSTLPLTLPFVLRS